MTPPFPLRLIRALLWPFAELSERLGNRFYLGLAVAVISAALYGIVGGGMKHQAYDLIMKSRFRTPPADPSLVLIDIDEASLEAMAGEYGRWPWPRAVMAELADGIAADKPAAIVFDIAFSDLDVDHPDGDRYFRDVVLKHRNTYFAMIRLNPQNDAISQLRLAQIPGVVPLESDAPQDATVAVVVPYFWNVLYGRRLGTNNLYPDDDGIARAYHVYLDVQDWRIYSLPSAVVSGLGGELPARENVLLNWRGRPPSYTAFSFHEVYGDLLKEDRKYAGQFAGKIVVIGSTAPSLFDITPTPMAKEHPGVEVLMTAIDNVKNQDYLTELPPWIYLVVTVVAIALLTFAFVYNVDPLWLYTLFSLMQTGFLGVTYLFLNYSTWFVDLSAPFAAALVFFFVAKLYRRVLVGRRNGTPWYSTALDAGQSSQVFLLACRFRTAHKRAQSRIGGVLQRETGLTRYGTVTARPFASAPLVDGIYDDTMLFYWLVSPERACNALRDLLHMLQRSMEALAVDDLRSNVSMALHALRFTVGDDQAWRAEAKQAVADVLQLASTTQETFAVTRAFEQVRAECTDMTLAPVLQMLGLGSARQHGVE